MKKVLLFFSLSLLATVGGAQVIFRVQSPSPNEGNYDFTYAEGATWATPDMTDPANAIQSEMVLVDDDGGLDNPIACEDVVNDLTGKIAVLYRGDCEFGVKALNAQDAGAIGVIIINNLAGEPVTMGGGTDGSSVTVPVVMISNVTGALLRSEIDAGTTEVFIGSKTSLYTNDLGATSADVLRTSSFGNVQLLSQNGSEFSLSPGSWIRNYGSNNQAEARLNLTIKLDGVELYNQTSDPAPIASGDSLFVELPEFSQETYANGYYEAEYTITFETEDESDYDNTIDIDFMISDDYFSTARLDPATAIPVNSTNQFNGTTDNLFSCLFFQDENASRVAIEGMNFSAGTSQNPTPTSIDGKLVELVAYEWNNEWTDINDDAFAISDLNEIAKEEYIYTADLQSENVYVPFEEPVALVDNQKYLFCMQMYGAEIYPGYDTKTDYNWNVQTSAMPVSPAFTSGTWYALGFGTDRNPSISINMLNSAEIGLVELPKVALEAFPNPSNHIVHIPIQNKEGDINLTIVDVNGKVVGSQVAVINNQRLDVDVTAFPAGMYAVNLAFADGTLGSINIMVTK